MNSLSKLDRLPLRQGFTPWHRRPHLGDDPSMQKSNRSRHALAGLLLGALLLTTLASCVAYPVGASSRYYGSTYPAASVSGYGYGYAGLNNPGNYHYYPRYGTYYNPQSRLYYYQQGSSWQTRSSPYGVSTRLLRSSPYVPLNLHSSPSNHHALVTRSYPTHWTPHGRNQGRYSSFKTNPSLHHSR